MSNAIATMTPLRDWGLRPPVVVPPEATILESAQMLRSANVSSLLVGEPGFLISIVTERDVVAAVACGLAPDEPITRISAENPFSVSADATLAEAGNHMITHGVRHLVVAEGHQAIGVISMRDVAAVLLSGSDTGDVTMAVVCGSIADRPEFWLG
jgi:CBS domain-containing protein